MPMLLYHFPPLAKIYLVLLTNGVSLSALVDNQMAIVSVFYAL